jgi:hypothetical protein
MQKGCRSQQVAWALATAVAVLGSVGGVNGAPAISEAHRAKLASPVQSLLSTSKSQRLIIQLQDPTPAGTLAQLQKAGARITRRYEFLPMVAANVPGKAIAAVAALPSVTRVSLDVPLSAAAR